MRKNIMKNRNKSTIKYTNKIRENKCAEIFQHTKTHSRIQWLFILARFLAVPLHYIWPVSSHAWTQFVAFGSHLSQTQLVTDRVCQACNEWKEIAVNAKMLQKEMARRIVATGARHNAMIVPVLRARQPSACLPYSFVTAQHSNQIHTSIHTTTANRTLAPTNRYIASPYNQHSRLNVRVCACCTRCSCASSMLFHLYTLPISYFVFCGATAACIVLCCMEL